MKSLETKKVAQITTICFTKLPAWKNSPTLFFFFRQMSGQVSRGSAGEDQADERAGVARLSWRVSVVKVNSLSRVRLFKTPWTAAHQARGWDGWMASPTRWTWVWVSSGDCEGQGSLVRCSPWGRKQSDTTERLKTTNILTNTPRDPQECPWFSHEV